MPEETVITVENVDAGYEDVPVLRDVTFSVRRGEVFAILGGSGCGKSTLLKHMIGLTPPLKVEIRLMGDRIFGGPEEERMVFDDETRALFREEVMENLAELDGALLELEKTPVASAAGGVTFLFLSREVDGRLARSAG